MSAKKFAERLEFFRCNVANDYRAYANDDQKVLNAAYRAALAPSTGTPLRVTDGDVEMAFVTAQNWPSAAYVSKHLLRRVLEDFTSRKEPK